MLVDNLGCLDKYSFCILNVYNTRSESMLCKIYEHYSKDKYFEYRFITYA